MAQDIVFRLREPDYVERAREIAAWREAFGLRTFTRSLRFISLISFFDVRVQLNPFLARSDLLALACTNSFVQESVELMMQLHWYECPRVTNVTVGSLDMAFMKGVWAQLTDGGKVLPCSGSLHMKLLQTHRHRHKLIRVQVHSRLWLDDVAFGYFIRMIGTMFVGVVRRDGDVFHDIASLVEDYLLYKSGRRYRVGHPSMSSTRCATGAHSPDELSGILTANSEWWFKVVVRFVVAIIRALNSGYDVVSELDVGDVSVVALGGHRLTRVDCFRDTTHARVMFNIAEPVAMAAITSAFI